MRARLIAALCLILPTPALAKRVPFVGCKADGQIGPLEPPRTMQTPDVSLKTAPKLAYYATGDGIGVLAPRGWQCFGWVGSNGQGIVVAPRPLTWNAIVPRSGFKGPATMLNTIDGGTSGRFEVARYAARAFPAAAGFVASVEAEQLEKPFPRGPYPADRRTYRGRYQLLFTTPATRTGLGTDIGFAPGNAPIDGVLWLHPDADTSLTSLAMRLPPELRLLGADIIKQATPDPKR